VLGGIDAVGAATLHCDRAASARERTAVARGIDAERESAGDGEASAGQVFGELHGGVTADRCRIAGADHRKLRQGEHAGVALDEEHERCVGDCGEERRILGSAETDQPAVDARDPALITGEPRRVRICKRVDRGRRKTERRERGARFARKQRRILAQRSGRQVVHVQARRSREREPRIRVVHVRRAYRDSHPAGSSRIDALRLA
jgi:hypothetical protein